MPPTYYVGFHVLYFHFLSMTKFQDELSLQFPEMIQKGYFATRERVDVPRCAVPRGCVLSVNCIDELTRSRV